MQAHRKLDIAQVKASGLIDANSLLFVRQQPTGSYHVNQYPKDKASFPSMELIHLGPVQWPV